MAKKPTPAEMVEYFEAQLASGIGHFGNKLDEEQLECIRRFSLPYWQSLMQRENA